MVASKCRDGRSEQTGKERKCSGLKERSGRVGLVKIDGKGYMYGRLID